MLDPTTVFVVFLVVLFVYAFITRTIFRINDIVMQLEVQSKTLGRIENELLSLIKQQNKYLKNIDKNLSLLLDK